MGQLLQIEKELVTISMQIEFLILDRQTQPTRRSGTRQRQSWHLSW